MMKIIYHRNGAFGFLYKSGDVAMLNGKTSWNSWDEFFYDFTYGKEVMPAYYHFEKAYNTDKRRKPVQAELELQQ